MTTNAKKRVTLFIDPAVIRLAKAQAVAEGTTLARLVEKVLIAYLPNKIVLRR